MNISGFFIVTVLNIIRQDPALLPNAGEEVDHTGDGIAVGGEAISQHKTVETPTQRNTEEPAKANAQHHAVQQRQCHTQLRIADTLDEGATAPHEGQCGEHPQDCFNKHAGHLVNCGVVGEDAEQFLTEQQIGRHTDDRQGQREHPRPVDGLYGSSLLPRRNILADHWQGGILDALRDLVDDVVDADTHAEGRRGHHAHIVDHGVDIQHGEVDAARLNGHGRTQRQNHLGVARLGLETLSGKVEAEFDLSAIEEPNREQEGHRLSDDGGPCRTCNLPPEDAREQDVQHQVDGRGDADKQKRAARIAHAAKYRGDHVIASSKEEACAADDEVLHGVVVGLCRDIHDLHDPAAKTDDDHRQQYRKRRDEGEKRTDNAAHFPALTRAQCLRDQHLSRIGKAEAHHGGEVQDLAALGHRREASRAHKFAHDDHVDGAVEHLHGVGGHERQHEHEQLPRDVSTCKVLRQALAHSTPPPCWIAF